MENTIARCSRTLVPLCAMALAVASSCSEAPLAATSPQPLPSSRQSANQQAPSFTSFNVPGSTSTSALDINARGDVVGRFVAGGTTHGFLRSPDGDFTIINYPGAGFTVASGINAEGDIVGWYATPPVPGPLDARHGYVLRNGQYTSFDPTGSQFTNPQGINARGQVVGRFCTSLPCGTPGGATYHGFLWYRGVSTTIDVPGSTETSAWKINSEGEMVGAFRVGAGPNRLFTLRGSHFDTFDLPGGRAVALVNGGINPKGDIVGFYCDVAPCSGISAGAHGFLLSDGDLTTIDYPGAIGTGAFGINPRGDVVGAYIDATGTHGYLLPK